MKNESTREIEIYKVQIDSCEITSDALAQEEPLEIRLAQGKAMPRSISITMRTPGHDEDLAIGFLFTEGIIKSFDEIDRIKKVPNAVTKEENIIELFLRQNLSVDVHKLERHFYTSSSCGVCGKTSIEAVHQQSQFEIKNTFEINSNLIHQLPAQLLNVQNVFHETGGLHAAGLFDQNGELKLWREDVGRHNAVDKLIGAALQQKLVPLEQHLILVSGRASFELIQKSMMAGIPVLAAVGAPSSLAIELAASKNMTVLGFVRNQRFNIYCGKERIIGGGLVG